MSCRTTVSTILWSILLCLVIQPHAAQSQEQPVRWRKLGFDPLTSNLYDCILVNDTIAIVVGEDGVIRRGTEITSLVVRYGQGGFPAWHYVGWYSDSVLVCSGDDGAIGWSHDFGLTWNTESVPGVGRVVSVARAGQYTLLATRDGVYRYLSESNSLERVIDRSSVGIGYDNDIHVAAMADGEVLRSSDNGETWYRDEIFSTTWPLIRLRESNDAMFFVHKRFITWLRNDGRIDTTFIPAAIPSFEYADIGAVGNRFYFTGSRPAGRHAYSLDGGRTLTVADGFAMYATNAVAVTNLRLLCVGDRGAIVLASPDTVITDRFRLFGFEPSIMGRSAYMFEKLLVSSNSLRVISSQPRLEILDTSLVRESVLINADGHSTKFSHASWLNGRTTVIVDTVADVDYPDGVRKTSRYILYTKNDTEQEWSHHDSPRWGIVAFMSHAVSDGSIYFSGYEERQLYRLTPSSGRLDSLPMPKSAHLVYANDSILIFRSPNDYLYLHRGSMNFESKPNPIVDAWSVGIGRNRRLFAIGTVVTGSGLGTRFNQVVRVSDDLGDTWTTAFDMPLPGRLSSVLDFYADSLGRIAFVGVGEGIAWSLDNGRSWHVGRLPIAAQLAKSVKFIGSNTIVVAGNNDLLHIGQLPSETSIEDEHHVAPDVSPKDESFTRLQAYDLLGRQQASTQVTPPMTLQSLLDSLRLSSGVYLFEGSSPRGKTVRGKFMVP